MAMLRAYLEFIKFSHTVFALPWALAAMMLAARENRGWPGWRTFILILGCMVTARTAAMAFNRIADRKLDALNPRTKARHLPAGEISVSSAWMLVSLSAAAFVLLAGLLNRLTLQLSPVALLVSLGYSYTKRFTSLSHFVLGLALGLSPIGAWIAVTGAFDVRIVLLGLAVMLWVAGFDIIYATQDHEFDKRYDLRSMVVRLGIAGSLRLARALHVAMFAVLVVFGLSAGLRAPYWIGLTVILAGLIAEHWIARKRDLMWINKAFLQANAAISFVLLASVAAEVWWM
jgi:4-hydroxybenzoate polyprenyltransferase